MIATYAQLQKQIANLQKEADAIKRKEVVEVIARIKEAVEAYGLTASDLGLSPAKRGRKAKVNVPGKAGKAGATGARFRDDAGNTWGGRGPRPQWLRDALAAGKSLQDFAV